MIKSSCITVIFAMIFSSTTIVSVAVLSPPNSTSSFLPRSSIYLTVQNMEREAAKYNVQLNASQILKLAETDMMTLVGESNFMSYFDRYGNSSFQWNLCYNWTTDNLSVYFQILKEVGPYIFDYS